MGLKIVCSGYMAGYPLGGFTFHHLQYLVGLKRLGHDVTYFEHFGWEDACYDPRIDGMTSDPSYGVEYLRNVLAQHGLDGRWCYLGPGERVFGMPRDALASACRDCDLYLNISNINWIPEVEQCRRRVVIDTDPVFTQIDGQGILPVAERHHLFFTYGENVHQPGCTMPTAGIQWLPTRQPIVLDLWKVAPPDPSALITTLMNWTAYGEWEHEGIIYRQKDVEFSPFMNLPRQIGMKMRMAVGACEEVERRLAAGGWETIKSHLVTLDMACYQDFIRSSKAEFSVAKQGYVATQSGWFSDRSAGFLASGRPVILQDTGFSRFLPCGQGLLTFRTPDEALAALRNLDDDYESHCRAARSIAEQFFDSDAVLEDLLNRSL